MTAGAFIASSLIGAAGSYMTARSQSNAASAQNKETMSFNREEAKKARDWQAAQSVIDRQFNANESATARSFASVEAKKARDFDLMMSNTAHQREQADLAAAGLNPILAANSGASIGNVVNAMPTAASHSTPGGAATATFNGGVPVKKPNLLGDLLHSAVEGVHLENDVKRAQADSLNALTNAKRQAQDALESMERITNIKSDTDLNKLRQMSEQERVNLFKEQIKTEVVKRQDGHDLSVAQQKACLISANAAAAAAAAQAHMADIQDRIQTAESPERINKLQKEAQFWQSEFDKNKWIITNPESINRREFFKNNPGATGVKVFTETISDIFHVGIGLHGVAPIGGNGKSFEVKGIRP